MAENRIGPAITPRQTENCKGGCGSPLKPDVAHLIRSVQRLEGHPDCFGKAVTACRLDCPWGVYCGFLTR